LTPRARERGRVALVVLRKPEERPHEQRSRIFPLSGRREQRRERVRVLNARGLADGLETAASGPYQEVPKATLRQTITALARTRLQDGAKAGPWRKKLSRVGGLAGPQRLEVRRGFRRGSGVWKERIAVIAGGEHGVRETAAVASKH